MAEHKRPGPYPPEVRERAVRMLFEHQNEYSSQWAAIQSISALVVRHRDRLRDLCDTATSEKIAPKPELNGGVRKTVSA